MTKLCVICGKYKGLKEFGSFMNKKGTKLYLHRYCKQCKNDRYNHRKRAEPELLKVLRDTKRRSYHKVKNGLKAELLRILGGKCCCCGEKESTFLQIHHRKGGGSSDRVGAAPLSYYKQLISTGCKDVELLCANCHVSKHLNNGVCAHQLPNGGK